MGDNYFTPYEDDLTLFKATDMNSPLEELDRAISYHKNRIVSCDGIIDYDKTTGQLTWDATIRVVYNRTDGYAVENTIVAGNVTLSDNQFAYVDLSETDGQAVSIAVATVTTDAASNFIAYNRFILGYRNATSDDFYPVGLRAIWGDASDAHPRLHDIDSTDDHNGVSGAVEDNLLSFDANGLPKDSGLSDASVTAAVAASHAQDHDIDSTADHNGVSGAVEDNLLSFDANGLPKDSGLSDANVTDAVSKKHDRDHDIDATADHNGVGGAVEDNLISFNSDALPKDSGLATSDVSSAITKSQVADFGATYNGVFGASVVVMRLPMVRTITFPASMTASQGVLGTAATAQTDFDLQKNAVSFGTMRFAAAGTVASFIAAAQTSFSAGDILTIVAPASPDATAADLGCILVGAR